MSESGLEMLRREARWKEVKRKNEAFRKEHVRLIGAIYLELLTSRAPTIEEINFF
jgi:hypothetical protein